MIVNIYSANEKLIASLNSVEGTCSVAQLKREFVSSTKKASLERCAFKSAAKGKILSDDILLNTLLVGDSVKVYFKDLGPQISYRGVFLIEYAGPLLLYLFLYPRPSFVYGPEASSLPYHWTVKVACALWSLHYVKRILETLFVHRFSHGTMPLFNLFKNSGYYWLYGLFVSYFINHPKFTPETSIVRIYFAIGMFLFCEYGNFVIHCLLANLRPPGTRLRKVPYPNSNPMSLLFHLVSCPNYTYEVCAWLAFNLLTNSVMGYLFMFTGLFQMTVWAKQKHRNYRKDFADYPKSRKAILPFLV